MSYVKRLEKLWEKEQDGSLKKWQRIVAIVGGIIAIVGGVCGIVAIVVQFTNVLAVMPTAVVDYESWEMASPLKKDLADPRSPTTSANPNIAELVKTQGMYHIVVSNESGHTVEMARAIIPDANYVEIRRKGAEPKKAKRLSDQTWKIGDIDNKVEVIVHAWTTTKPDRKRAKGIVINHDSRGPSAAPYVRKPANWLADCINEYTIWFVIIALVVIAGPLGVYKYKLCQRFCTLVPKRG